MRNNLKKTKTILLLGMLLMFAVLPLNAQAASSAKWPKACKAYKSFLAKNESKFTARVGDFATKNKEGYKKTSYFNIADLDGNGVPELVTYHELGYKQADMYVFTYKSGKVTRVKNAGGKGAQISATNSAGGSYNIYICKKGHLHRSYYNGFLGLSEDTVYSMKSGRLREASTPTDCARKKKGDLVANTSKYRKKYLK